MRVIRTQAKQAHAIPNSARYALGNRWWTPEDLIDANSPSYAPKIEPIYDPWVPYNATAQNNYQGEQYYSCSECEAVIPESLLAEHICEE
jgi:hypothetical protein